MQLRRWVFACYVPNPEDDNWTEESTLVLTQDGYKVADAPPLDPTYARRWQTDWQQPCSSWKPGAKAR